VSFKEENYKNLPEYDFYILLVEDNAWFWADLFTSNYTLKQISLQECYFIGII